MRRVLSPIGSFKKGVESITRLISSRYPYRFAQLIKDNGIKLSEPETDSC